MAKIAADGYEKNLCPFCFKVKVRPGIPCTECRVVVPVESPLKRRLPFKRRTVVSDELTTDQESEDFDPEEDETESEDFEELQEDEEC